MNVSDDVDVQCPYCGSLFTVAVESYDFRQEFVEDCAVCCRPLTIVMTFDEEGTAHAEVHGEDE